MLAVPIWHVVRCRQQHVQVFCDVHRGKPWCSSRNVIKDFASTPRAQEATLNLAAVSTEGAQTRDMF
jgi:hypothetical protein